MATLCTFPCNLNSLLLKYGLVPGSESPTFVSTVLCDQAIGSAIHKAPALQEEGVGGRERHTCTVTVILPKNKGQHKPALSFGI